MAAGRETWIALGRNATGIATRPFPIASSTSGPSARRARGDIGRHMVRPFPVPVRERLVPAHRPMLACYDQVKPIDATQGCFDVNDRCGVVHCLRGWVTMLTIRPGTITIRLAVAPSVWRVYSGWLAVA
jgi:hypothetical protein